MMRRRSAPSSGTAANGISILPSGDAIVEVMLDNDDVDDTKKSSTASQIRTRLIRFTRPFAILAICIGICSKAMMMKIISERYSSLPILSIFTADDNRESSYMRRSLKIEEAHRQVVKMELARIPTLLILILMLRLVKAT